MKKSVTIMPEMCTGFLSYANLWRNSYSVVSHVVSVSPFYTLFVYLQQLLLFSNGVAIPFLLHSKIIGEDTEERNKAGGGGRRVDQMAKVTI